MSKKTDIYNASAAEKDRRNALLEMFDANPVFENEKLDNLGLFIKRQSWSRFLFMNEIYQRIINVHGVVMEFGVRWGQNLAYFSSLRGIYEPFNHNRRIVGFDTFEGFPSLHGKDGNHPAAQAGGYGVSDAYEDYLEALLAYHESESPISHIRKFELVKGDVTKTLDDYLDRNPQTIVALAYLDLDIYEPTRHVLEKLRPRLAKGSVIGFDELNHGPFPGETMALMETLGIENVRIQRVPYSPMTSFVVVE